MAEYKILLVDDEAQVLTSLKRALHSDHYMLYTAPSAEEAEAVVKTERPHMIICDYQLDGVNGMDFLKKVSRDFPEIVTILLTGHAELHVAIEAINKAVLYKFIIKPWDNDELRVTIMRAVEYRALLAENKKLATEIAKRDDYIVQLEKECPGITKVKRDTQGRIVLDP
ncbi:MAG: response regulator [Candidatus Omnitrophica bacterium]|nr:response regulator [Candidatus Omnitrophota bacterium]